jgi:hypothetical protein
MSVGFAALGAILWLCVFYGLSRQKQSARDGEARRAADPSNTKGRT